MHEVVTESDIAEIVSKWTGIPVTRLVASERDKLLRLAGKAEKKKSFFFKFSSICFSSSSSLFLSSIFY